MFTPPPTLLPPLCDCQHLCTRKQSLLSLLSEGITAKQLVPNKCSVMSFPDNPAGPGHASGGHLGLPTSSFGLPWNLGEDWRLSRCWGWCSPGSRGGIRWVPDSPQGGSLVTHGQGGVDDVAPSPPHCGERKESGWQRGTLRGRLLTAGCPSLDLRLNLIYPMGKYSWLYIPQGQVWELKGGGCQKSDKCTLLGLWS